MTTLRPSGLLVPLSKKYNDSLRFLSPSPALEGMGKELIPVVIVDDLSGVAGSVAQSQAPPVIIVNPAGSGLVTTIIQPTPGSGGTIFRAVEPGHTYAHNTGGHNYAFTFPVPMKLKRFMARYFVENNGGGLGAGYAGLSTFLAAPDAAELVPTSLTSPWASANRSDYSPGFGFAINTNYWIQVSPGGHAQPSTVATTATFGDASDLSADDVPFPFAAGTYFDYSCPDIPILGVVIPATTTTTTGITIAFTLELVSS